MINDPSSHVKTYFSQVSEIAARIPIQEVQAIADHLVSVREANGRLFILGVGGSAANCSHAVNDFRKLCGIECYAPTDNVAELTARINDEGWEGAFAAWLRGSRLSAKDALLILSVGGGNAEKQVSINLIRAIEYAKLRGANILGIVGRDGGFAKRMGDAVVVIPTVDDRLVTPHAEAFQAVIWHCLVSHPQLQVCPTKW